MGNEWPPNAMPRARMVIWVVRACATDAAAITPVDRRPAIPSRSKARLPVPGVHTNGARRALSIILDLPLWCPLLIGFAGRGHSSPEWFWSVLKANRQIGPLGTHADGIAAMRKGSARQACARRDADAIGETGPHRRSRCRRVTRFAGAQRVSVPRKVAGLTDRTKGAHGRPFFARNDRPLV